MNPKERCCALCKREVKCRHREISQQAWGLLLKWHEIDQYTVGRPLCNTCYADLRNILIDRTDEIDAAIGGAPKTINHDDAPDSAISQSRPKTMAIV